MSWYDLKRRSDDVAAGLLALGVRRGDRVGIWAPNRVEWLLVQFGTARIGAILVNINPAYRATELEYALQKVGCRVLVMAARLQVERLPGDAEVARARDRPRGAPSRSRSTRFPRLERVVLIGDGAGHAACSASRS